MRRAYGLSFRLGTAWEDSSHKEEQRVETDQLIACILTYSRYGPKYGGPGVKDSTLEQII